MCGARLASFFPRSSHPPTLISNSLFFRPSNRREQRHAALITSQRLHCMSETLGRLDIQIQHLPSIGEPCIGVYAHPLPTSRRPVVSGPPRHIWNGRHPESAKQPPLPDSHTPLWTLFFLSSFFIIPLCVDSTPPRSPKRVAKSGHWACHPLLRIHSYNHSRGPQKPFLVFFTSTASTSTLWLLNMLALML